MLSGIIKQFNWVDIFVVIILFRIGYIALKNGLPVEFFKLLGTASAIYLSLHYYVTFPDRIIKGVGVKNIPLVYLTYFSFILLAVMGYLVFMLLSKVFSRFVHMEAVPNLNKWGSLMLGIIRSFLLASLLMFAFAITPVSYFRDSVNRSYSGRRLFEVAPATYSWIWNSIISKFKTQEKFNNAVLEVQKSPAKK